MNGSCLQTWILDANIGEVVLDKDAPSDVDKIIKEIKGLLPPIASREWLYKYMEDQGYSTGLRLWMGSNLVPDGQGKYKWGFNIEGADGEATLQHFLHSTALIRPYNLHGCASKMHALTTGNRSFPSVMLFHPVLSSILCCQCLACAAFAASTLTCFHCKVSSLHIGSYCWR